MGAQGSNATADAEHMPRWSLRRQAGAVELALAGDWTLYSGLTGIPEAAAAQLDLSPGQSLRIDTSAVTAWDSTLPAFLLALAEYCRHEGWKMDAGRLPAGLRTVLARELADRVLHDLRNPLNALSLHADLLARLLPRRQLAAVGLDLLGEVRQLRLAAGAQLVDRRGIVPLGAAVAHALQRLVMVGEQVALLLLAFRRRHRVGIVRVEFLQVERPAGGLEARRLHIGDLQRRVLEVGQRRSANEHGTAQQKMFHGSAPEA